MKKVDSENKDNKEKKDGMLHIQRQFLMFDEFFFKIKIHWKNWLNTSFDVEFNSL